MATREESWLTTKEASDRLGVSRTRVTQLIRAGQLKAKKLGRDWLIQVAELARFEEAPAGRPHHPRSSSGDTK